MRVVVTVMLLASLALGGCAGPKPISPSSTSAPVTSAGRQKLIITPDTSFVGKVVGVNTTYRFVVVNFPIGHLPTPEQHLNVYRRGLKVGEVKVTSLQRDDNVVADIVDGECALGDEVRQR